MSKVNGSNKLTIARVISLHQALKSGLDGYDQVIRENGTERVVRVPYTLGAANLKAARNCNRLETHVKDFQDACNKLINELSNGKGMISPADNPEDVIKFISAKNNWESSEVAVDLIPFTEAELRLDINPIPPSVLATLDDAGLIK